MSKTPAYKKNIKVLDAAPVGYLSCTQYSARLGLDKMAIHNQMRVGRFPNKYLVIAPVNGKPSVHIDYNKTVVSYLEGMQKRFHPDDWTPGSLSYKPMDEAEWKEFRKEKRPKKTGPKSLGDRVAAGDISVKIPDKKLFPPDMHEAKLVHEHKKIEKLDLELRLANNKLIETAEVVSNMRMLAVEIKQAWDAYEIKLAPLLAAEGDVKKIKEIMKKARGEVLKKVAKLENGKVK